MATHQIRQVDLDGFEILVYQRRHQEAADKLLAELRQLRLGVGFIGYERPAPVLWTRLCAAMVSLFFDPGFKITDDFFAAICEERSIIELAFRASAFGSADYVYELIPKEQEEGASKYLAFYGLASELNLDLKAVFENDPQGTLGLYLSLIGHPQVLTKEAHARREALIEMAPIFEGCKLPGRLNNALAGAYMHVSYASGEKKHLPKRVLHGIIDNTLPKAPDLRKHTKKKKPVIVIPVEWWHGNHAMYRCYGPSVAQLRDDFHLIGLGRADTSDDEARAVFHEWMDTGDDIVIPYLMTAIAEKSPDIIYYPSIGMSVWTQMLASRRLAPAQVMTYGHPATSGSKEIDFGVIERDLCSAECFDEQIMQIPSATLRYRPFRNVIEQRHKPHNGNRVRIGIAAMQVKVGWPFIEALQQIEKQSKRPVEFQFLCAASGVGLYSFAKDIGRALEYTNVCEKQSYDEYLDALAACDLALFSFPFGGTNSVIDAMTLGLPMVTLEGKEPHAMTDAALFRRAGLPEWLIAKSVREYIDAVLMLTYFPVRERVAKSVRDIDVKQTFFGEDESKAFLGAFKEIYRVTQ